MFWPFIVNQSVNTDFFWSNLSGTQCWLTKPEHLSTCRRCSTKEQRTPQRLENGFVIHSDGKSMFWQWCYWITPRIHTFWAQDSGILTGSTRISVHPWNQSGLVWFSINGQNIDLPLWHNRFSGCWGVKFWSLIEYLSLAKGWPGGISHHSVPL